MPLHLAGHMVQFVYTLLSSVAAAGTQAKETTMKCHEWRLKTGITRTREFERKRLACFAVNCGLKCGHDCLYCSTGAVLRTHPSFKAVSENPFGHGYCILDPSTPERVARDAARIRERGLIQLCTLSDAWAPEAKQHNIGRRCLEAILSQPGWSVRILTKNAAVVEDFDLIEGSTACSAPCSQVLQTHLSRSTSSSSPWPTAEQRGCSLSPSTHAALA